MYFLKFCLYFFCRAGLDHWPVWHVHSGILNTPLLLVYLSFEYGQNSTGNFLSSKPTFSCSTVMPPTYLFLSIC